jgi:hypothetical protein
MMFYVFWYFDVDIIGAVVFVKCVGCCFCFYLFFNLLFLHFFVVAAAKIDVFAVIYKVIVVSANIDIIIVIIVLCLFLLLLFL